MILKGDTGENVTLPPSTVPNTEVIFFNFTQPLGPTDSTPTLSPEDQEYDENEIENFYKDEFEAEKNFQTMDLHEEKIFKALSIDTLPDENFDDRMGTFCGFCYSKIDHKKLFVDLLKDLHSNTDLGGRIKRSPFTVKDMDDMHYAPDVMNYQMDEDPEIQIADDYNDDETEVIKDYQDPIMAEFNRIVHDMRRDEGIKNISF